MPHLALLLFSLTALAQAHVGAPLESIDVQVPLGSDTAVGIEASVGWIWSANGQDYEWLCHEAITAPGVLRVPDYVVSAEGVMLARISDPDDGRVEGEGLYRSAEGCDWAPVQGLSGRRLAGVAMHPTNGELVYVVTADVSDNAVLRSVDSGARFSAVYEAAAEGDVRFTSVVVGPDGAVWAGAVSVDGAPLLFTSPDGEAAWQEQPISGEGTLTLLAAGEGVAYAALGSVTSQVLLRLSEGGAEVVLEPGVGVTDVAIEADGAAWAAVGGQGYWMAPDGRAFAQVEAPPGLGVAAGREQLWLATRFGLTNIALAVGDEELGFVEAFTLYQLDGPPERCGPETDIGRVCPADWEALAPELNLVSDTGDTGPGSQDSAAPVDSGVTADKDCGGCAVGPGGGGPGGAGLAGGWLFVALLAAARQRRV